MKKILLTLLMAMVIVVPAYANETRKDIRENFKTKLRSIRDEKKKALVEKLDARFAEVNTKRTTQMAKHLDKMTEILGKTIPEIQKAREANTAQAAKTYIITITTEKNLKMDVGKVRSQLEADLKAVHELVVAARKAVKAVIK